MTLFDAFLYQLYHFATCWWKFGPKLAQPGSVLEPSSVQGNVLWLSLNRVSYNIQGWLHVDTIAPWLDPSGYTRATELYQKRQTKTVEVYTLLLVLSVCLLYRCAIRSREVAEEEGRQAKDPHVKSGCTKDHCYPKSLRQRQRRMWVVSSFVKMSEIHE